MLMVGDTELSSGAASAADAAREYVVTLAQSDSDGLMTVLSGLVSISWFSLLAQLLLVGVILALVFATSIRRF